MSLAADPRYRSITLQWANNLQTGTELVQLFARALGGAWALVRTLAVGIDEQAATWDTAAPVTFYDLAMRYANGSTPAVGYESDDPDAWTAPTAAGSKTTVVTTAEEAFWVGASTFVNVGTPVTLSWTSIQQNGCYLLEKSDDGGSTWSNVAVDLVADSYAYTVQPSEVGNTVRFRLTSQRGAVVGPSAGYIDVPMFVTVGPTTWVSGTLDGTTGKVSLVWNSAPGAVSYLLEKSDNGGATWSTIGTIAGTSYSYSPTTAEYNTTVNFRLTGKNGSVSGPTSASEPVVLTVAIVAMTIDSAVQTTPGRGWVTFTFHGGSGPVGSVSFLDKSTNHGDVQVVIPSSPFTTAQEIAAGGSYPRTDNVVIRSYWSANTGVFVDSNVVGVPLA